jgi:hypothetical protein
MAQYCVVVKRGESERYDLLYKAFVEIMPVIWDRRHRERRTTACGRGTKNQRTGERRGPQPTSWIALGFVVAQHQ